MIASTIYKGIYGIFKDLWNFSKVQLYFGDKRTAR